MMRIASSSKMGILSYFKSIVINIFILNINIYRYELLQKCWNYRAEARPTFRHCLELVSALRDKTSPNVTLTATPVPPPNYLTLLSDG